MRPGQPDLSPREKHIAKAEARSLLRQHPWLQAKGYDQEDLFLEAVLCWLAHRHEYDAARGANPETFMKVVIRSRFADILREQMAAKRGGASTPLSLDEPVDEDEPSETRGDRHPDPEAEAAVQSAPTKAQTREAIARALGRLTKAQQKVCRLLAQGADVPDVSKATDKHRATVYREIARIRAVFEDEGLEELLPRDATDQDRFP
jgi:DNA-directed RNA polymerase specialized sigma24 family protein